MRNLMRDRLCEQRGAIRAALVVWLVRERWVVAQLDMPGMASGRSTLHVLVRTLGDVCGSAGMGRGWGGWLHSGRPDVLG